MEDALLRSVIGDLIGNPAINQIIMGVVTLLGFERLFSMVMSWRNKKKRNGDEDGRVKWRNIVDGLSGKIEVIEDNTNWLKDIHDRRDEDGVPVWYVRPSHFKSLEVSFEKFSNNVEKQTQIMDRMWNEMKDFRRDLERMENKIT